MHEPHISLYHIGEPHISCSKTKSTMISCSKIKSTIYMYKFEPCFILYMYSNNDVQKFPCHMAIIQNSGSKSTSVCTYEQKDTSMYAPYTFFLVIPHFAATAKVFREV